MRLLLASLCWALLIFTAAEADTKKDLRGFYPGMSKADFDQQFKKAGCGGSACKVDDGSLGFVFTKNLNPPALKEVIFKFKSGTPPQEMIAQISKQFNARPVKSDQKKDFIRAMGC